jgi:hypothetical protein
MTEQSINYSIPEPSPVPNDRPSIHDLAVAEINDIQELIAIECDGVKKMLLDKNRKYGNSAIQPRRIFSSASAIEQINVRIDDKLSRIASRQSDDTEDAELDLIGYLILKRVALAKNKTNE